MKTNFLFKSKCFLVIVCVSVFSVSCTNHFSGIEPESNNDKRFVIKPQVYISDPWTASTKAIGGLTQYSCVIFLTVMVMLFTTKVTHLAII